MNKIIDSKGVNSFLSFGLDEKVRRKIVGICKSLLPECTVWLYGSRARGDFRDDSDIDIAIECPEVLTISEARELREVLSALNIIYKIDLVDLKSVTDQDFIKSILKERVLWRSLHIEVD